MTATDHRHAATQDEQLSFGGYARDGSDHAVVAVREDGAPWRLLDVTSNTMTVIEAFYPGEQPDAVQAVADLYLAEMRS